MSINVPIMVLALVFVLIAVRQLGRFRVSIWQAMVGGALIVLLNGDVAPAEAWAAIDWDVMLFLFGMFVVGQAAVNSGELYRVAYEIFSRARSIDVLVLSLITVAGAASALLMNDTLAIIGTPLVLRLAREHGIDAQLLLLALAFAVTTGSVLSPIGNPQNLLIAVQAELNNPFLTFLEYLAAPTLISLVLIYVMLRLCFRHEFHPTPLRHTPVAVHDAELARGVRRAVQLIVALILLRIGLVGTDYADEFRLSYIALAGAAPLLLFSPRRVQLLSRLDWSTLAFFVGLFVLMDAVWRTGVFQGWLGQSALTITDPATVFAAGAGLSQLISNVPLVALYLPLLQQAGADTGSLMALAASSTLAGNLLILGAASNIIIIQSAERQGARLGFFVFARLGIPLTILQLSVYWLFL